MDHDDYLELGDAINKVNLNQIQLNNQNNNQILINEDMLSRLTKFQEYLGTQTKEINLALNKLENTTNHFLSIILIDQQLHRIGYNLDTLNSHILDITDAIIFAKLQIISRYILNNNETNYIREILEKQDVSILAEENIYELLTLQAYYNQSNIIFSIQIPKLFPDKLTFYKLKPLPLNNSYTIEIESENLILNEKIYMYVHKPCITIEQTQYCEKEKVLKIQQECVPNLILNNDAHCDLTQQIFTDEIEYLLPGHLYTSSKEELIFTSTCNQNQRSLKGLNLIKFKNCIIKINNNEFGNNKIFHEQITIVKPYNKINVTNVITKLDLPIIHNWTIGNNKAIKLLQIQNTNHKSLFAGIIISIPSIIGIYIIAKIIKSCYKNTKQPEQSESTQDENHTPTPSVHKFCKLWPSLRREELRHSTAPPNI